ncbi:MAG: hypothetical protein EOP47_25030, partial [Sphingobacteriaceae bacterium]
MKIKQLVMLIVVIGIMAACKKDRTQPNPGNPTDTTKTEVPAKDTIYLLDTMVQVYSSSKVKQTEIFNYNTARQLTKYTLIYTGSPYPGDDISRSYYVLLTYKNNEVSSISRFSGSHQTARYTYLNDTIRVLYSTPVKYSSIISLNSKGQAEKIKSSKGDVVQYVRTYKYDEAGNLTGITAYKGTDTVPFATGNMTYDNKRNPLWALRDNTFMLYRFYNMGITSYVNNMVRDSNGRYHRHTYNKAGYPEKTTGLDYTTTYKYS